MLKNIVEIETGTVFVAFLKLIIWKNYCELMTVSWKVLVDLIFVVDTCHQSFAVLRVCTCILEIPRRLENQNPFNKSEMNRIL